MTAIMATTAMDIIKEELSKSKEFHDMIIGIVHEVISKRQLDNLERIRKLLSDLKQYGHFHSEAIELDKNLNGSDIERRINEILNDLSE